MPVLMDLGALFADMAGGACGLHRTDAILPSVTEAEDDARRLG